MYLLIIAFTLKKTARERESNIHLYMVKSVYGNVIPLALTFSIFKEHSLKFFDDMVFFEVNSYKLGSSNQPGI